MGGNNLPLVLLGEAQKNIKRDTTQLPQPQIKRVPTATFKDHH